MSDQASALIITGFLLVIGVSACASTDPREEYEVHHEDRAASAAQDIVAQCIERVQPLDITSITSMEVEVLIQCAYEKAGQLLGPLSQQVEDYLLSSDLLPKPV
jgi:hypothetical protein